MGCAAPCESRKFLEILDWVAMWSNEYHPTCFYSERFCFSELNTKEITKGSESFEHICVSDSVFFFICFI